MKEKKEIICPVSFVTDSMVEDVDINSIFIDPYMSTETVNAKAVAIFDLIKPLRDQNPDIAQMAYFIDGHQLASSGVAIKCYILMNCRNLIHTTIYRFLNEAFKDIDVIGINPVDDYYLLNLHARAMSNIDIDTALISSINYSIKIATVYQNQHISLVKLTTESMMSMIFNDTVATILTPFIENLISAANFEPLFNAFTKKIYGKTPDKKNSLNDQYVFISSTLNEIMSNISGDLYLGYMMMADSIAQMILSHPKYFDCDHFDDPNYRATDAFKNSPLLKNIGDSFIELANQYQYKDELINDKSRNGIPKISTDKEENIGNEDLKIFKF